MLQRCENCGNDYDKTFTITLNGQKHIFDCFECAINKLAPHCSTCHSLVIGHGVEVHNKIFCSNHCSNEQ